MTGKELGEIIRWNRIEPISKSILLLRNCRHKLGVLNDFVSEESRSLFEIVKNSLSVLLFVVVEAWVHIIRSISQHAIEDTGQFVGRCGIGF